MKLFLEDEHAVHKLVASQYKISPEKLMRTGNYTGNCKFQCKTCETKLGSIVGHSELGERQFQITN